MITKIWYDNNLLGKEIGHNPFFVDLTGQVFGKWTVISLSSKKASNGGLYWHCRCECGKERDVLGLSLRNHRSLSCGNHPNISKGNVKISELLDEAGIEKKKKKKFLFNYEYTHNHDSIKSQWCKNNNIPLIRIPYTRYKDLCLEDLLLDTSNYIEE